MSRVIYMSLRGLMAYVGQNSNRYTRAGATQLWNIVTAHLPQEEAIFDVRIDKTGEQVTLTEYRALDKEHNFKRLTARGVRLRAMWVLAPALVKRFQEIANANPQSIDGYGPHARDLLQDWINSRPR